MLCTYSPKAFVQQLNDIKVDGDGVTPVDIFSGITTDVTQKYKLTW